MSTASASRTIKFISKAGTYFATIMSPSGDLYQEYGGTENEPTNIKPSFSANKPILYFVCTSSRVNEGIATPTGIRFFFNDIEIQFSGDTSTGVYAGYFKKISPSGDNVYYGLQIVKDIVVLSGFAPATVKMVATIAYANQTDSIQATYTIPIQPSTGTSYRVTIAAGDTKNFVIAEKGGSCILKALAYQAGTLITKELTYVWEKMSSSGWTTLSGKTAQTLTVRESDIQTYGEYRVTVSRAGENIGSDVQGVMDVSDPYDIDPHPVPEDETITEDASGNGSVTYTPVVVKRGTSTKVMDTLFFFVVRDASGVILNPGGDSTTAKASYAVTRTHCVNAGGSDVSLIITSEN